MSSQKSVVSQDQGDESLSKGTTLERTKTSPSPEPFSTSPEETNEVLRARHAAWRSRVIASARGRLADRLAGANLPFRGIEFGKGGAIEKVQCKVCGTNIVGLVEDERYERTERINKKVVIYKRLVATHLPTYRELQFYFDDQSAHITHCCATCAPKIISDLTLAEECYKHDLAQWSEDERRGLGAVRWDVVVDRKIISVEEVSQ